jgi:iron complex transport system ATP-binding protein
MSALVTPLLTVDAIGVRVGGTMLLRDISFALRSGRILALLGANGAGKSTLVATLAGELPLTGGCIELHGRPLTAWSAAELAGRRALNASEPAVPFALRVADYVALGQPFDAPDAEAVAAALTECHAAEWRGRDYATLSLGEQMRVQLARSLYQLGRPLSSTEPQSRCLWLLDEPCAHLDMAQRHFVLTLIARIAREREWAVVFSTHDPMEAQLIADHALLLQKGEVLAFAEANEALTEANLSACYGRSVALRPAFVAV